MTAGTALNRIRVPLDLVFDAAERAGRVGRTAAALSAEHGLRYGTALRLLHRLRFAAGALVPRLGIPTGWGTVSLPCTPPGWPGWLLRTRRPHRNADAVVDAHLYRDAEGRWDVRFEPRDREPRLPRVRTDRLGLRIAKVLHLYHRGVSANWLPVYVRALAAAWQRGPTRDEVLAAGSWTRVVHYVQLRAPPSGRVFRWHYPPWWYSTRENLPDRPYWD